MSENSQDYAQKTQHDCTFMNSASVYAIENLEVQDRLSLHLNCFQWIIYFGLLFGFCCTQKKLAPSTPNPVLPSFPACISWCKAESMVHSLATRKISFWSLPPVRSRFNISEGCTYSVCKTKNTPLAVKGIFTWCDGNQQWQTMLELWVTETSRMPLPN